MQDPSLYAQMNPIFPEQEHLKCPRCDSPNTKFCYYNNYNLSQPRFFCKSCKRYWTKGGSLRNIPVGGASRKNTKRSSSATKKPSSSSSSSPPPSSKAASTPSASSTTSTSSAAAASSSSLKACETGGSGAIDQSRLMLDMNGNFGTLLGSSNQGHFDNFIDGSSRNGLNLQVSEFLLGSGMTRNVDPLVGLHNGDEESSRCWNGDNGWPDLSIYPPGSSSSSSRQ